MRFSVVRKHPLAVLAVIGMLAAALSFLAPAVSGGVVGPASVVVYAETFQPPPEDPPRQPLPALAAAVLPLAGAVLLVVLVLLPLCEPPARAVALHVRRRHPTRAPPPSR